jgi:hypothetical protein
VRESNTTEEECLLPSKGYGVGLGLKRVWAIWGRERRDGSERERPRLEGLGFPFYSENHSPF